MRPGIDAPAFAVVNCVAQADGGRLTEILDRQGFAAITLDGRSVHDEPTLLAQAGIDLPAVADMRPGNLDALAEYFGSGLYELGQERIALLWTDVEQILSGDLEAFLNGVHVFTRIASSVRDDRTYPLDVLIFLLGNGPGFRPLAD